MCVWNQDSIQVKELVSRHGRLALLIIYLDQKLGLQLHPKADLWMRWGSGLGLWPIRPTDLSSKPALRSFIKVKITKGLLEQLQPAARVGPSGGLLFQS